MRKMLFATVFVLVMALGIGTGLAVPTYLVYDSGADQTGVGQNHIQEAMTLLGYAFDVRDASNVVTAADITSGDYEALVIGWSASGFDMSGLSAGVVELITGNKLLTGHDADFHTWAGNAAAATFMDRAVLFAGADAATGILAFPVFDPAPFGYLPGAWGISSFDNLNSEEITAVTADGVGSGLYDGLTLGDLSYWGQSYHAGFTAWDPTFSSFELGMFEEGNNRFDVATVVTIGTTVTPLVVPEPSTLLLLGGGLLGLASFRRKFKV